MKKFLLPIKKLFAPKIICPLSWSCHDFEKGKKWAKSRLHPDYNNKTIWDIVYSPRKESIDIIHEINKFIEIENSL